MQPYYLALAGTFEVIAGDRGSPPQSLRLTAVGGRPDDFQTTVSLRPTVQETVVCPLLFPDFLLILRALSKLLYQFNHWNVFAEKFRVFFRIRQSISQFRTSIKQKLDNFRASRDG